MPTSKEVIYALYGTYRLARFDAGGMRYFDTSIEGFWRSFFAAAIIAPFYAVLLWLRFGVEFPPEADGFRYLCIEIIAYVIAWVLFPLVMISVVRFLELDKNYLRFIVAYNWASVLQNALYMPIAMAVLAGGQEVGPAAFLLLIALVAILVYTWFIAKTALDVPGGTAAAIVALDFVLGLMINGVSDSMI